MDVGRWIHHSKPDAQLIVRSRKKEEWLVAVARARRCKPQSSLKLLMCHGTLSEVGAEDLSLFPRAAIDYSSLSISRSLTVDSLIFPRRPIIQEEENALMPWRPSTENYMVVSPHGSMTWLGEQLDVTLDAGHPGVCPPENSTLPLVPEAEKR
ncbi:hypothetical protein BDW74DRAFT_80121 [Aspergillus multicolor]|uniref:uncharacterized protein n=1 Tax=Aspergillus multicolor TaxID=41759 RepID=UPI003CCCC7B8